MWATHGKRDLVRIDLPTKTCHCLAFAPDGKLIVTGWDDGAVRAFLPESGKLKFEIGNAHHKGVTAVAVTRDGKGLLTGGADGHVRTWDIAGSTQVLLTTLSQHKAAVSVRRVGLAGGALGRVGGACRGRDRGVAGVAAKRKNKNGGLLTDLGGGAGAGAE